MKRYLFLILLSLTVQPLAAVAESVDWAKLNPELSDATYVKDDQKCLECHEDYMTVYLKSAHAKAFEFNPTTDKPAIIIHGKPVGNTGCENCHGPMSKHLDAPRKMPALAVSFKKESGLIPQQMASVCLQCHEKGRHLLWQGGVHDRSGVSCKDCHSIHSSAIMPKEDKCYSCHPQIRALFQKTSHIPVREGKVACSGCHNVHGSKGLTLLNDASVNDTCYSCHADKRGPFLWEHAPVRENCLNCHNPHGSNHPNLLKIKPPYLCQQQCHTPRNHPTTAYNGKNIVGGTSQSVIVLGKNCLNCHSQVHGSNHPSGAVLQR